MQVHVKGEERVGGWRYGWVWAVLGCTIAALAGGLAVWGGSAEVTPEEYWETGSEPDWRYFAYWSETSANGDLDVFEQRLTDRDQEIERRVKERQDECRKAKSKASWVSMVAAMLSFLCGTQGLALLGVGMTKARKVKLTLVMVTVGMGNAGVTALSSSIVEESAHVCGARVPPADAND